MPRTIFATKRRTFFRAHAQAESISPRWGAASRSDAPSSRSKTIRSAVRRVHLGERARLSQPTVRRRRRGNRASKLDPNPRERVDELLHATNDRSVAVKRGARLPVARHRKLLAARGTSTDSFEDVHSP